MTIKELTEYLDKKIKENENEIIVTYFELRVKMNLSEEDTGYFLNLTKVRLENLGYTVYFTGDRFVHNNEERIVQSNELMIAIK